MAWAGLWKRIPSRITKQLTLFQLYSVLHFSIDSTIRTRAWYDEICVLKLLTWLIKFELLHVPVSRISSWSGKLKFSSLWVDSFCYKLNFVDSMFVDLPKDSIGRNGQHKKLNPDRQICILYINDQYTTDPYFMVLIIKLLRLFLAFLFYFCLHCQFFLFL